MPDPLTLTDLPDPPFHITFRGRQNFGLLLNKYRLNGIGVEVGTHQGEFAAQLLSNWGCKKLYCVDPWNDNLPDYVDKLKNAMPTRQDDLQVAIENLAKFGNKVHFIVATSEIASILIQDELDFVYIDGDHREHMVRQDIELWLPKLKSGGILAGHDIEFSGRKDKSTPYKWRPGIERVLREKFSHINLVWETGYPWSWYVVKV